MPHSFSSQRTRNVRKPSSTSTDNGPTEVSMRSTPNSRDARTVCCSVPTDTVMNASVTPRLGYWPIPVITNSSSLLECMLK